MINIKINKKNIFISISLLFLLICVIIIDQIQLISLSDKIKLKFIDLKFQSIDCLNNEVVLTEESGDLYTLNDKKIKKIASLKRLDAKTYKSINSLAHTTSLNLINNDIAVASNSFDRLPGKIVIFDYQKLLSSKYLEEDNLIQVLGDDRYNAVKLSKINLDQESYFVKIERDFTNQYYYSLLSLNLNDKICSLNFNEKNIQNIYWDENREELSIISNPFPSNGGQINTYNIIIGPEETCPKIIFKESFYYLTLKELEDMDHCLDNEYHLFIKDNNSYLFYKSF